MKEKRNIFGLNGWRLLFSFIVIYFFFFSEKGQQRVNAWINLFENSDKQTNDFIVSQTDLEKEFEKTKVAKWISRKYKVSNEAVREIVEISFSAGSDFEVDPYVIIAVIAIESSFNPLAESSAGALILKNFYLRYGNYQRALLAYVGVSQNSNSSYPKKVLRIRDRLKKLIKTS